MTSRTIYTSIPSRGVEEWTRMHVWMKARARADSLVEVRRHAGLGLAPPPFVI
jgi:hypothetical protein